MAGRAKKRPCGRALVLISTPPARRYRIKQFFSLPVETFSRPAAGERNRGAGGELGKLISGGSKAPRHESVKQTAEPKRLAHHVS
jgi:hypothetical protein